MRRTATRLTGDWRVSASCQHKDPDALFVRGAKQHDVKEVCAGCPVLTECLSHALDNRIEFGVWGGMTERQRRALLKTRPEVTNWAEHLEARLSYEARPSYEAPARSAQPARSARPARPAQPARSARPAQPARPAWHLRAA